LVVELPGPRDVDVAVYAIDGQRVRSLAHGPRPAGRSPVDWDGLDQRGARARPGVYLVRMTARGESSVLRIVKLD
jgi:flagellar hook assembly protein FlgD